MMSFLQSTPRFRSQRSGSSNGSRSPSKRRVDDPSGPKSPGDHLTHACVLRDQPEVQTIDRYELKLQRRDDDLGEESPIRDDLDSVSSMTGKSVNSSRYEGKKQRTCIRADHLSNTDSQPKLTSLNINAEKILPNLKLRDRHFG